MPPTRHPMGETLWYQIAYWGQGGLHCYPILVVQLLSLVFLSIAEVQ